MFQKTILNSIFVLLSLGATGANAFPSGLDIQPTQQPQKEKGTIEVTIENLTLHQVMTPPVLKVLGPQYDLQGQSLKLFSLGEASSPALTLLAEDGDTSGYTETPFLLVSSAPILPGEESKFEMSLPDFQFGASFSMVAMLANTNDAFAGLSSFTLEPVSGFGTVLHEMLVGDQVVAYAQAYDAGTEKNTELCAHIPGPSCGSPGARVPKGAEGQVSIHPGLHLQGDLAPDLVFSPKAVAKVTIKRIK